MTGKIDVREKILAAIVECAEKIRITGTVKEKIALAEATKALSESFETLDRLRVREVANGARENVTAEKCIKSFQQVADDYFELKTKEITIGAYRKISLPEIRKERDKRREVVEELCSAIKKIAEENPEKFFIVRATPKELP